MWENSVHVNGAIERSRVLKLTVFDQIVLNEMTEDDMLLRARERQEKDVDSWYEFFFASLHIFSLYFSTDIRLWTYKKIARLLVNAAIAFFSPVSR